jgi:Fungal specific transcription factor domain
MPQVMRKFWDSTVQRFKICSSLIPFTLKRGRIDVYLENMTALSLFHRPTFKAKLESIPQPKVRAALLSAMFSFSTRYVPPPPGFSPQIFHDMAYKIATDALEDYGDASPCVHLSQSAVLISLFELADGVRGKAWRTLGQTLRCAIEMNQNAVDIDPQWPPESIEKWVLAEERRRLFWSLWEFDVFAGTIRRAPSAIDWKSCRTMLPVSDENWFTGKPQRSCFLHIDSLRRIKELMACGNEGGRAWFIVINSIMREAHLYTEQLDVPTTPSSRSGGRELPARLEILENAATYFKMALPSNLGCNGVFLDFDLTAGATDSRALDSLRYSIYAMQQLTEMMIHRHAFVGNISKTDFQQIISGNQQRGAPVSPPSDADESRQYSWFRFKHAADNIVRLARMSPVHHVQSVSPFLSSTIWIAAAALLANEIFATSIIEADGARSKVEVLQLLLERYASFWQSSNSLVYRLAVVRQSLKKLTRTYESRNVTPPVSPTSDTVPDTLPRQSPDSVAQTSTNLSSSWQTSSASLQNPVGGAISGSQLPGSDALFSDFALDPYETYDLDQFILSITTGGDVGDMEFGF